MDSENSSQRRLLCLGPSGAAPSALRSAWTQASKPALTDVSLAAKRRAEALQVVFYFFSNQASEPSTTTYCFCCSCCVYSRIIRLTTKATRWVRCSSWSLGPSPRRPTSSCSVLRRGAATAFAHRGCVRSQTHRSLLLLLCVPRTAPAVPGSSQLDFCLIQGRCHFSI